MTAPTLADALRWYEEQARLCRLIHSEGDAGRNALAADGGQRARAALAAADAAMPQGEAEDLRVIVGHAKHHGGWCVFEETAPGEFVKIKGPFPEREQADSALREPATPQPVQAVPPEDVAAAARLFRENGYRGPLHMARLVFDWVDNITGEKTNG